MRARTFLASSLGLALLCPVLCLTAGCAVIPDPTFETADAGVGVLSSDATITQNPPITSLDAQVADSTASSDAGSGTGADSGVTTSDDASAPRDASSSSDDASRPGDSSVPPPRDAGGGGGGTDAALACLPPGAPAGTSCCPKTDDPCIGLACAHCAQCNCPTGQYCCATENPGGKFKATVCVAMPNAMICPAN